MYVGRYYYKYIILFYSGAAAGGGPASSTSAGNEPQSGSSTCVPGASLDEQRPIQVMDYSLTEGMADVVDALVTKDGKLCCVLLSCPRLHCGQFMWTGMLT